MQRLDDEQQQLIDAETAQCLEACPTVANADHLLPFANQLEPTSLIHAFLSHPPAGFDILDTATAGLPAFAAPFDLLTTADESLSRRVQNLPLYRHWAGLLKPRVAFVGTTVSEYVVLPRDADLDELPRRWQDAWGDRYPILIVKDLPQNSPLLSDAENRVALDLAQACEREGFFLLEGQALAYVPIDFANVSTYLGRLSKSRRRDMRRKMRSLDDLEVIRRSTGDPCFSNAGTVDQYFALYRSVFAQSKTQFDLLSRDFFAATLREPSSGGVVFEYRRRGADAQLVGWNLCFIVGGKLVDKYIGFVYPAAQELNLYFVSWIVNLEFAIHAGLSHYIAGWSDPEVKAQLGATFTFTRHAVYSRHTLLRAAGRRFGGRLESDRRRLPT